MGHNKLGLGPIKENKAQVPPSCFDIGTTGTDIGAPLF